LRVQNPDPTHVLGVFGLDAVTDEQALRSVFSQHGDIEKIMMINDRAVRCLSLFALTSSPDCVCLQTGRSKGFGFVYFKTVDDAQKAREACNGMVLHDPARVLPSIALLIPASACLFRRWKGARSAAITL
jgi:transformer-2 protein